MLPVIPVGRSAVVYPNPLAPEVFPTTAVLPVGVEEPGARRSSVLLEKRHSALGASAGLFTAAILLKRLPARPSAYQLIPTDWKQWAKAGLGVAGIARLNEALDWQPPLWLGTLQTVGILTPLLQKLERGLVRQFLILAPLVTGLVQLSHWASEKVEKPLAEKWNIPPLVTKLGFSVLTTLPGMKAFPAVDKAVEGWFPRRGEGLSTAQTQATTAATGMTCARGCCASAVCLNEIGEYGGAIFNWIQSDTSRKGKQA